jgi:hypothetical protein
MNRSLLTPRLTPPGGSQPNASSIASASQSSIPGRTWEYVSSVIEMVAWPKSSCTSLTWTPRESRIVAHVCLYGRSLYSPECGKKANMGRFR